VPVILALAAVAGLLLPLLLDTS